MSLIEVLLARKEVLISLVVVGLVLLSAVGLAFGPGIFQRWKKSSAKRAAARAERIAEAKRTEAKKKRGRARKATPAPAEAIDEADEEEAVTPASAVTPATVAATTAKPTPAAAASAKPAPAAAPGDAPAAAPAEAQADPVDEEATETPTEEAEAEEEEKSSGNTMASAMQDILDSVFVDEDVSGRYDTLLQGIEVGSAEELLDMANRIAAELGTKRANRSG
jgi:cytoskeletal protein RodZ